MMTLKSRILIFGASGAIGSSLTESFAKEGHKVLAVYRNKPETAGVGADNFSNIENLTWDVLGFEADESVIESLKNVDSVIWSQGANCNDDIFDFDLKRHELMYSVNVSFILKSLHTLIKHDLLKPSAKLCVISSIWQNLAKQKKLSYCITKSALEGLVQSLAIDLGHKGFLVNAVLPGALDTPMTRANLTDDQIDSLEKATPLSSLPTLQDVFGLVSFLCSESNTGITGQFIAADRGFSRARII